MNRRQFLARTAALNVPLIAGSPFIATPLQASGAARLERVVADERFAASVAFAEAMAESGTRVSRMEGDLTSLWFNDLQRHFTGSDMPVAGLTTARTGLVIFELARGPGVRVLWRAEHRAMADGSLRHDIEGSALIIERAAELGDARDWSADLGSLLAQAPRRTIAQTPKASAVIRTPPGTRFGNETMSSWILAPRRPGSNVWSGSMGRT